MASGLRPRLRKREVPSNRRGLTVQDEKPVSLVTALHLMPPKGTGSKGAPAPTGAAAAVIETTFPVWVDAPALSKDEEKVTDKFEDIAGLTLPTETQQYLDTWKRPEELVQNMPNLPVVVTKPVTPSSDEKPAKGAAKNAPAPVSREFEGKLFAGHKTFEWLQAVMQAVISARHAQPPGHYLWELIYPRDPKDNTHIKPPNGKYRVKLFIMDTWRTVVIDDRIPVDLFGRPLLVSVMPLALWPLLLSKAILKVMASLRVTELNLPHQVAAFHWLTGWPHEDLLDPLAGPQLAGGFLFDRLEDAARANEARGVKDRAAVATLCLKKRALPAQPPPRIVVLTGPSAVGRAALMHRLVSEFPDKFGLTVSHTTRPPREHEVQGQDYVFCTKTQMKSLQEAGQLLECAPVVRVGPSYTLASMPGGSDQPQAFLYGTSIATVREVAATGKLCLMGLEEQGVEALKANKRIDGLYVYCAPPSLPELEQRMRGRLKEASSTIDKRLAWAAEQVNQATKPGLFDHVVPNNEFNDAYYSLKEAISTLSPIIRNRLRGLPAYVLDYSDLIPPNLVEKPFLKPVIIAGPTTGERARLIELLVSEFPDVFAFPRLTTTCPPDEVQQHVLSSMDLQQEREARTEALAQQLAAQAATAAGAAHGLGAPAASRSNSPTAALDDTTDAPSTDDANGSSTDAAPGAEGDGSDVKANDAAASARPEPIHVTSAEFDQAVESGQLLEQHSDLFKHSMMTHRVGTSANAIREVIKSGRLPLLELEVEGASALKSRGIECLTIFLQPGSLDQFKERLLASLTETDDEVAARLQAAEAQIAAAATSKLFDHTLVNSNVEDAYAELRALISKVRPDIIVPDEDSSGPEGAVRGSSGGAATAHQPVLVLTGTNAATVSQVVVHLQQSFPSDFAVPALVTDRKPGKGQTSSDSIAFVTAKELNKMATENQLAVQWQGDGGKEAVVHAALEVVTSQEKVAVLEMLETSVQSGLPALKAAPATSGALYIHIAGDTTPAEPVTGYDLVVTDSNPDQICAAIRAACVQHVPDVVKPPYKPIVLAAPFGTGARQLLQQLYQSLPGKFASPYFTTTKPPTHPEVDDRPEMLVIEQQEAAALLAGGAFLFHTTALGHTYGVQTAHVERIQASGKVCIIEVDTVENVQKLRAEGFEAVYMYVGMSSMDDLLKCVHTAVAANAPLGYEPDEAAALFLNTAKAQVQASKEQGVFDAWVEHTTDTAATFSRLSEAIHLHYPDVVVPQFVYGYGRGLWDPAVRQYGRHPLHVMLLGPAGAGKTTQARLLASKFALPHVNVGDLLYDEMAKGTARGLLAKEYTDASKTVPDDLLLELLFERLAQPDCIASGWLLDGFPHTQYQTEQLRARGLEPDKVIFLHAENTVLLDRTRWRRVDLDTGAVYHCPESQSAALSPAIMPLTAAGTPDKDAIAKLYPRHDDSEENVLARLDLWDKHVKALRQAYENISLRLKAAGSSPAEQAERIATFLTLEARVTELQVTPSHTLKELQYEVLDTLRYRQQQLLRVCQDDGRMFWLDCKEALARNAHCCLLAHNPAVFPIMQQLRRLDLTAVPRTALLWVNTPEPAQVIVTMSLGPQAPLEDIPMAQHRVLMVCGPTGAGKARLVRTLLQDYPDRLVLIPPLTTRPPLKGESNGKPAWFADSRAIQSLQTKGQLLAQVVAEHDGYQYAVRAAAVQAAWAEGKLPVVVGPLALAASLKAAAQQMADVACADTASAGVSVAAVPPAGSRTGSVSGSRPMTAQSSPSPLPPSTPRKPAAPPQLSIHCLYLHADIESLDTRLREQQQLEEQQLQHQLQLAAAEMQQVQPSTSSSSYEPQPDPSTSTLHHVPDVRLDCSRSAGSLWQCQAKQAVAELWHRPRPPVPCQAILESYQWDAKTPGATVQRLRSITTNGGTLEFERGQHLLRVTAAADYPHSIVFHSVPPCKQEEYYCKANELSLVMSEMCEVMQGQQGDAGAVVTNLNGQCVMPTAGGVQGVLRYKLQVQQPTLVTGQLSIAKDQLRQVTRMLLIDNTTGIEVVCPAGRLPLTQLEPTPAGYTLLAVAAAPLPAAALSAAQGGSAAVPSAGASAAPAAAAGGAGKDDAAGSQSAPWFLQLLSSAAIPVVQACSVARAQLLEGMYTGNSRAILGRYLLTPIQPTHVALHAATQPRLPFYLRLFTAPTGKEVSWQEHGYPQLSEQHSNDGQPVLLCTELQPGKVLVQLELDAQACPEGWQPDPLTGVISDQGMTSDQLHKGRSSLQSAKPVSWQMTILPSTDEKVCPITADDSQARYFKSMQEGWAAAATGGTSGGGAAKPAAPAKPVAGKSGLPLTGRAAAAAALLDKTQHETRAASAIDPGNGTGPSRPLKDGTVLPLVPSNHLQYKEADPQSGPQYVKEQQDGTAVLSAAVDAVQGEVAATTAVTVQAALQGSLTACQTVRSQRVEAFTSWRSSQMEGQLSAAQARMQAMLAAKQETVTQQQEGQQHQEHIKAVHA